MKVNIRECNQTLFSLIILIMLILSVVLGGCVGNEDMVTENKNKSATSQSDKTFDSAPNSNNNLNNNNLKLNSIFPHQGKIPSEYTCDGEELSPAIQIEGINVEKGVSVSIIVDDPDAPMGVFTHWVIWNIPVESNTLEIPKAIPRTVVVKEPIEAVQGINDFGKIGYNGPCPPSGEHTYSFKVYVLDSTINLGPDAGKKELQNAIKGHILQEGVLNGRYTRSQ